MALYVVSQSYEQPHGPVDAETMRTTSRDSFLFHCNTQTNKSTTVRTTAAACMNKTVKLGTQPYKYMTEWSYPSCRHVEQASYCM